MHPPRHAMKRLLTSFLAALLALFTSSCVEHETVIVLHKDGSGTITERTFWSADATATLEKMAAKGQKIPDPLAKIAEPEFAAELAKKLGVGVEVEKSELIKENGRKGVRTVFKFKDINEVKYVVGGTMAEANKAVSPPGLPQEEPASKPITFKYEGGTLRVVNPDRAAGQKKEKPEIDEQQLEMAKGTFKDMKLGLKLEFPGGIAETDANHVSGNSVTLAEMEFGKLLEDPAKFKKLMELDDPTLAGAAFKGEPGFKVQDKETVTVKLK